MAIVEDIGRRLTPYDHLILAKAGEPRWFDLPRPWIPAPGRQTVVAQVLAATHGLLEPAEGVAGAYQLTDRGEHVAAWVLLDAFRLEDRADQLIGVLDIHAREIIVTLADLGMVPCVVWEMGWPHQTIERLVALDVVQVAGPTYHLTPLGQVVADHLQEGALPLCR
jgi:hypothetical protein